MSMKVKIPNRFDDFSDELIWNDSKNTLLIRNKTDKITLRIDGFDINTFNKFKSYIENNEHGIFKLKLLNLIHNATNVTQIGQQLDIQNISDKFTHYCNSCDKNTTYQIQGKYRGKHAECIYCGNHDFIRINNCCTCNEESIFVKTLNESYYTCYNCNKELD